MNVAEAATPSLIVSLEEVGLNGLPALRTQYYDGWVLRLANGYSRRANSVTPLYHSTMPLERKLAHCESIFEAAALPCIFKMTNASQPLDLDRHLKIVGYERDADTVVQTRLIDAGFAMPSEVELHEEPIDEWFDTWERLSPRTEHSPILRTLLRSAPPSGVYALARRNGEAVGCARAACSGHLLGLFDLLVAPEHRGKGWGTKLVAARMSWGYERGARLAYLQVMAHNEPARGLQHKLGFEDVYTYWYRVPSAATDPAGANC